MEEKPLESPEEEQEQTEEPKPGSERNWIFIRAAVAFGLALYCIKDGWITPIESALFNKFASVVLMPLAIFWFIRALRYKEPPAEDKSEPADDSDPKDTDSTP